MINKDKTFRKDYKDLWELEPYRTALSIYAKNIYAILEDRYRYTVESKDPKFIDSKGQVYTTYAEDKLAEYMNINKRTVIRAIKELEDIGLLRIERKFKAANRYYVQEISSVHSTPVQSGAVENSSVPKTDSSVSSTLGLVHLSHSNKNKNMCKKQKTDFVDKQPGGHSPKGVGPHEQYSNEPLSKNLSTVVQESNDFLVMCCSDNDWSEYEDLDYEEELRLYKESHTEEEPDLEQADHEAIRNFTKIMEYVKSLDKSGPSLGATALGNIDNGYKARKQESEEETNEMPKLTYSFTDQHGILHVPGEELTEEELRGLIPTDFQKQNREKVAELRPEKPVPHGMVKIPYTFFKGLVMYVAGDLVTKEQWDSLQPIPPRTLQPWEKEERPVARWDKQDIAVLKEIMGMLSLKKEDCDPLVKDWSQGRFTSHKDITQENIKAFIKYLKGKAIELYGDEAVEGAIVETVRLLKQGA